MRARSISRWRDEPDDAPRDGSSCVSEVVVAVMVDDLVQYVVCAMVGRRGMLDPNKELRGHSDV